MQPDFGDFAVHGLHDMQPLQHRNTALATTLQGTVLTVP